MKLVYLHGPPASGKLTIAKSLLTKLPGRLFDNHASIDLALTLFDFGAPGFWKLVAATRLEGIKHAANYGVPLMVMTTCYSHPEDYPSFQNMEGIVTAAGGSVLPVFLSCAPEELKTRVGNQDRIDRQKIGTVPVLEEVLEKWNLVPVPRENCLQLQPDKDRPDTIAQTIINHFGL